MSDHPTKDELSDFALGKLPTQLSSAVEAHLVECPPCQETIHSLEHEGDTLLLGLRRLAAEVAGDAPVPVAPDSSREQRQPFVARLLASGVLSRSEWDALNAKPEIAAADGHALPNLLVERKVLTSFQAERIMQGETAGLVFSDYVVLDKLGAGGMGQVYKARHRRMDRIVALKVMSSAALNSPEAVKRFHREVKAAARLTHPNIVIAYDAGEANGVHYLVMEYVAGEDLAHRVKQDGPLPVDLAMDYIRQAAQGLAFAHGKGIVHRDIKPANLLVDAEGTLKILDMGLARLDGDGLQAAAEGLTQSGQVMGTVDYMAPEQAFDTRQADARADTYSLGVTLYRLLTGQNLFAGETVVQKILAHREKPIPPLRTERPQVPAQLDALFHRMVAKQPGDRPSMAEIASELAAIDRKLTEQSNEPTTNFMASAQSASDKASLAASPSSGVQGPPRNRRPGMLAGAAAAGFVFILAAVWVIFRDKDGNETGRQRMPDGGKFEVVSDPAPPTVPASLLPPGPDGAKQPLLPPGEGGRRPDEGAVAASKMPTSSQSQIAERPKAISDPAFQQWMKDVAAMPAEQQVAAVAKKLQELNPGFDGKTKQTISYGVISFEVNTDAITDISPVRALAGLKSLNCSGSWPPKSNLSDLSPLQGLRLTYLAFSDTKVSNLAPLKGMPLTILRCNGSYVSDLSPLTGMPLTTLWLSGDPVSDLSPLKGMKLKYLALHNSQVSDLSPLQGLPLITLTLGATPVSLLSPLKGMKLITLDCEGTKISDLSPLQGMPLTVLHCQKTSISDISPLKGMPLTTLGCNDTKIDSLSALKGMPLKTLDCSNTRVSDLAPLQGVPLTSLNCYATQVSDLTALTSTPALASLDLRLTKATAAGIAALQKALPNCKIEKPITTLSDPGFLQWMKDVAPLPAEQQLEAVAKKLQELNPGFDGKLTGVDEEPKPRIENGVVTELKFHSDNVTDLSPVRVLAGLEFLMCGGSDKGPSKLFDLGPLSGMKLTRLGCKNAPQVSDLSPLQGMTLTGLYLRAANKVSDLSPLRGMPLQYLNCTYAARLSDLSPLKGMPLLELHCGLTNVSDLSPLQGMHLTNINCSYTQVSDLSPLKGMELSELGLNGAKITDWSPLQEIKVTNLLNCSNSNIKDLSPLRGMPMRTLWCGNTSVSDLSPLEGCKRLAELRVVGTKVTAAGVVALQKTLPNCKIEWDGSAKAATSPPAADQLPPAPGQP